jgi:putative hydrolase of HD superfamily
MKKNQIKKLTSFFFEIGNLRKVLRAHQQMLLSYDLTDTIASHSFRVALIGYFLAKELKTDENKVIKMCLLHDLEESRSMDHHWVSKRYVKVYEDEIRKEQLKDLLHSEELIKLSREYQERKTLEAKIAKDADLLDEIFLLREYAWQGNKEAVSWLKGTHKKGPGGQSQQERLMSTKLAKEIAKEAKRQLPSAWWEKLWTPKQRK